jgi:branched-chain amino acid transport system ATP-binding protein
MLELADVTAGYRGTTVLHSVDLAVPEGKVVALLGPNGAGKTTHLRLASRMIPLTSGRITFAGKDVSKASVHAVARAGFCYIPEGRGVFPTLSVRDNLLLFGGRKAGKAALAPAGVAFPSLARRMRAPAGTLSGGERQMLALARAWLSRPRMLLVDEVSMGLAPKIVDEAYAFLRLIADQGTSLLVVEQYVGRIRDFADYAYLLRNGRIDFAGEPQDLGGEDEILGRYLGSALHE